jgi:phenylacetaldehyde dehydrogenase
MAIADPIDERARQFVAQPRKMLIGGDWVPSASGKTFDVYNPATGDVLAQVAEGSSEDVDRAVKTARSVFEANTW